jgi:hypothetical protein
MLKAFDAVQDNTYIMDMSYRCCIGWLFGIKDS